MSEALDLTKVFDRDTVKFPDGTEHEIRNPEEFSILEEHRLNALLKRIEQGREKATGPDSTEADAQQASEMLRELAALLVVDLPADAEVTDWVSAAVFDFWITKQQERAEAARLAAGGKKIPPRKPRRQTTARSQRGSKSSSAGRRKTG